MKEKEEKMPSSSSHLTCKQLTTLTLLAVVIQIIGLFLFVMGFFPVKPTLSGVSGLESFIPPGSDSFEDHNITDLSPDQLKSLYQKLSGVPPSFDRLVLMVIDGLPAEFVIGKDGQPPTKVLKEAMPHTQSLLAQGKAIGYHAKAAPPTVTMPRLKAIVSGAIGGFLDVAFNFNTQALLDDNLVGQFLRIGWKMLMFGDDTWLKLFPGMFTRHDGVHSFFVKDTVQVDHNVSRHLSIELNRTDWNLMILHYLGLDHLGHLGGRNSVLMAPKLREMDEVIKMIDLSIIESQNNDAGRTLLMILSDHGMTENGNHGGSSYEETDSLALLVGLGENGDMSTTSNIANQVDMAPTLALLFGVPIPKNNVGILMAGAFESLTDDEQLRLMELNSWQLLRLLQAQLPDLVCEHFSCDNIGSRTDGRYGTMSQLFCCLYLDAASLHESWKLKKALRSTGGDDCSNIILAYRKFLKASSEWLSHRATDRPVGILASGVVAMLLSCFILSVLLYLLIRESCDNKKQLVSDFQSNMPKWGFDEIFSMAIICILVLSMGSSSMVEEEQYIWHFMTSSFFLILFRKTVQTISARIEPNSPLLTKGQRKRDFGQIFTIIVILSSGRILRGWHQGGVNWVHLPDISKWLEQAGSAYVSSLQVASGVLLISLSFLALLLSLWPKRTLAMVIASIYLFPGLLVLHHIIKYHGSTSMGYGATIMVQRFYAILSISTIGIAIAIPWLIPSQNSKTSRHDSHDISRRKRLLEGIKDSTFITGWAYLFSWCLLQLLLQQPINSMPLVLLFIQILATMWYSSNGDPQWVEIAALYYLGMAGHFGLGNSNTLATIDVAGAFIGVSSYSTLLSGILMFIITYASPMLALLSTVVYISVKDIGGDLNAKDVDVGDLLKRNLGLPCLLPLGVNSVLLTAYTIVLLLMRNHLFIWSVFSPKYLYATATTACGFIGVSLVALSVVYTVVVLASRRM